MNAGAGRSAESLQPTSPARRPRLFPDCRRGTGTQVRLARCTGKPVRNRPTSRLRTALREDNTNTQRNPLLSLRLSGSLLLRFDDSRFLDSLLFQDPPRRTRARPPVSPSSFGIERPLAVGAQQAGRVAFPSERVPRHDTSSHVSPWKRLPEHVMSPPFKTTFRRTENAGAQTGQEAEPAERHALPRGKQPALRIRQS